MEDRSEYKRRLIAAVESRQLLLSALIPVAEAGGFSKPDKVALWMATRLGRRLDDERNKKLRDWRQRDTAWEASASAPTMERAFHLVKIEQLRIENEQLPPSLQVSYETIIKRACALRNDDVNALGKRAVQLLLGARRKPARRQEHPVETQALAIVQRINADWYPPAKIGRPRGAMTNAHFKQSDVVDYDGNAFVDENGVPHKVVKTSDVRLTYEELVAVALPSILNLGPVSRELTVKIFNVLTALAKKLDQDFARSSGGHTRGVDEDKMYASLQEIAERYMRLRSPVFDAAERAQLEAAGR